MRDDPDLSGPADAPPWFARAYHAPGALTGLGPISMDMYLPSLPAIAHVLDAPKARVQLTIAGYLIGFAVGQVI